MEQISPAELDAASGVGANTKPHPLRWIVATVLFVSVISAFFDRISIAVLFTNPPFQSAMGTGFNPARLGLLMTVFLFAYGASGLLLSFIGDVWGPKKSLAATAGLWGGFMLLMATTSSFGAMLWYRFFLGTAEGPQFSLINSLVKRWFPPREQARASSIWLVGSPLGSAVGFPLAIFLVARYGWRASFVTLAAFNLLIVLPLTLGVVRDWPYGAPPAGAIQRRGTGSWVTDVSLFIRDWRFWMITIFQAGALIYLWGLNSWLPTYLVKGRHFDLRQLGVFTSLPFVVMFLGQLGGAYVSDKLRRRAIICFVGLAAAGVLMYLVSAIADPYLAVSCMALSAGCWGAVAPSIFALAIEIIPARVTSTGIGVCNGIGNLVGACAPLGMGWLIGHFGNFDAGLNVMVVAGIVGSFAMIPLLRRY